MNKKKIFLDIETTGLNPINNEVTCICARDSDGQWFADVCGGYERMLLNSFFEWLSKKTPETWIIVTKNGKQFDIPFLVYRACVASLKADSLLLMEHIDIQEVTSTRVKLDDMALLLGVERKLGKGEDAIKLFREKRYDELGAYCKQDVRVTEMCYWKLHQMGLVK